jgi:hypothetical protein
MKKALLLMALFAGSLLSANAQTAAADRTLTAFVKPGETQWLAIQLNNGSDKYVAFQLDVKLPENLTYAGSVQLLRKGETAPHEVYSNQLADGTLKIASFSYKEEGTTKNGNDVFAGTSGDLLLIKVTASGSYVAKNVQVGDAKFVKNDASFTEVPLTAYVAGLLGDVNGDNEITAADASLIQQNVARKFADDADGYEVIVADVNGADKVTAADASLVQQFVAKKIKSFGNE